MYRAGYGLLAVSVGLRSAVGSEKSLLPSLLLFLNTKYTARAASMMATTPPITPPAIAPVFEPFFDVDLSVVDVDATFDALDALDALDVLDVLDDEIPKRG